MSKHSELLQWQQRMREQPQVWVVLMRGDGQDLEDTGTLYESKEAALVELEWRKARGQRAHVSMLGNLTSLALSVERWLR